MKNAPPLGEALHSTQIVPFFSDNAPISGDEWIELRMVALTAPKDNEPRSLRLARLRIENAITTLRHFRALGISPSFSAYEYEALKLRGYK